jgi:hypothetical protein
LTANDDAAMEKEGGKKGRKKNEEDSFKRVQAMEIGT